MFLAKRYTDIFYISSDRGLVTEFIKAIVVGEGIPRSSSLIALINIVSLCL